MLKIKINTAKDFTPKGKRRVNYVKDHKCLTGYVSGRIFRRWPPTQEGREAAIAWRDNTTNLTPQPWGAF